MRSNLTRLAWRAAAVFGACSIVAIVLASGAHAAAGDSPPGVSIAGDSVTAHVTGPTTRSATLHLVVSNDGDAAADVTFALTFRDGTSATVTPASKTIGAHKAVPVDLTVNKYSFREVSGRLTATAAKGATTSVAVTISRSPSGTHMWWTIGVAAVLALVAFGGISFAAGSQSWTGTKLGAASKWSFSQSWAQNITGLSAVVGTVLGASGFVGSELEGLDTAKFLGLNILAGALVLAAPLMMLGHPTQRGFLLASTTTLLAAFLEFATLGELLWYSHASTGEGALLSILIAGAILLLLVYGITTASRTIIGTRRTDNVTLALRVAPVNDPNPPPIDGLSVHLI